MRKSAWRASLLAASAILLASCAQTNTSPSPEVVAPETFEYSEQFKSRLADEMEASEKRPCNRQQPRDGCSAWKRIVIDHGDQRDKIRAAEEGE